MSNEGSNEAPKIKFKSINRKKKQFRRRVSDDDDEDRAQDDQLDPPEPNLILAETLELQKLRQRSSGISNITLASGQKLTKIEESLMTAVDNDPFKIQTGGLLDLRKAKAAKAIENGEVPQEDVLNGKNKDLMVGTQFSKETRIRDEDEEMQKFIESEMERRRGKTDDSEGQGLNFLTPEDRALLSLPENLRKSTFSKSEDMLSSQMLSGIPEVDLGIEEKIRNIEATESAKKKWASEARQKKRPSEFVPSNLAVNFKVPDRFKIDIDEIEPPVKAKRPKEEVITQRTVVVGDVPELKVIGLGADSSQSNAQRGDKATDDLHVSKFKQHFHRK
ncbi:hypothetical protein TCAL_01306 [Tigriopus californicus]|uniref:Uncharacterized protein n=1 Tax=Tigriopus californicus TaxID=6832 RepID=A0A553P9U4_TIGCA|nr:splicing factor C9orf78-like [Tigriopus californicus]TRY74439.1 hypothetical protein TCAL_01306 [Tigriopus californicus]|eukprot:TCALIF_01306-PA protein Name:"Similar to C9orf78 Uncharacterized protein C9orf78 (Homo sapiens)" AED:0.01 eAED:0.02 QI:0/-1/0/1/-1/1/1/0/332